jgi:hypothetical protein
MYHASPSAPVTGDGDIATSALLRLPSRALTSQGQHARAWFWRADAASAPWRGSCNQPASSRAAGHGCDVAPQVRGWLPRSRYPSNSVIKKRADAQWQCGSDSARDCSHPFTPLSLDPLHHPSATAPAGDRLWLSPRGLWALRLPHAGRALDLRGHNGERRDIPLPSKLYSIT